jgi:peptidoglycan/xylan/chitin deacetylase (PgdA/CDA1 family)
MSGLDNDYLKYSKRQYGNDHGWYDWSMLGQRKPITWPNKKPLAVWINVSLQHFPLNQQGKPFKVPFGMTMPYPDLRHYSLRDYGNRVGIYRFLKLFEANDLPVAYAINATLAELAPKLLDRIGRSAAEILAHGWDMDHLHSPELAEGQEQALIERSVSLLANSTGRKIKGWLSPARNQSWQTMALLPKSGVEYCLDWVNDDMPYPIKLDTGSLTMLPLNTEIEDSFVMGSNLHSEDEWVDQVTDAIDFLIREATESGAGRMLGISLHPWLTGQPHRIGCLERVVQHLQAQEDKIWLSTPGKIVDHFNRACA